MTWDLSRSISRRCKQYLMGSKSRCVFHGFHFAGTLPDRVLAFGIQKFDFSKLKDYHLEKLGIERKWLDINYVKLKASVKA
jgi:hypothetical protein